MRTVKVIRDPKVIELVSDETRRRMIYLLRAKEASVNQVAQELGKTPQAIYHHVRKLLEGGLIEVAREERIGHLVETYYRATAEVFQFSHGEGGGKVEENTAREALQALAKVGFPIQVDDELVGGIVKLFRKESALGYKPDLLEKIETMDDLGFLTKQYVTEFAKFLSVTDKQFDEYIGTFKEIREVLKSKLSQTVPGVERPRKLSAS